MKILLTITLLILASHAASILAGAPSQSALATQSQQEAVSGLSNRQMVLVRNAGYNLFMASPEVTTTIQDFMRGKSVDGRTIYVALPELATAGLDLLK